MKHHFLKSATLYLLLLCSGCSQDYSNQNQQEQPETHATTPAEADTLAPATPEVRKPETTAGDKVIAVKDGDSIDLLRNNQVIKVRLYGVDSPEKNQAFGQRAKQFASDLCFGKYVQLIAHNTDRYGRTVGSIILPDGRNLNEEMVRAGFAWHYKAYSKDQNLANLETDARRFKRGLWQDPNPTPPWDFRKNKGEATATAEDDMIKNNSAHTPLPAGATKRKVYICDSSGSAVYHVRETCSVLKRCKAEVVELTEANAIRQYGRRLDKTCGS